MGQYIIDSYDLSEAFKIKVMEATGLDITPKAKEREQRSWPEESGVDIDTDVAPTFEPLNIRLNCYVKESTYPDCIKRINGLIALLSDTGYHLLGSQLRNRLYPVRYQDVTEYKRINSAGSGHVTVTFSVLLLCPLPECRMGSATVLASGQVSLNANTGKQVTVWWGDGNSSTGTGALTHTYTNAGTYTVLIAGTGVTKKVFTVSGITIDEYSYPATGDVTHVTVSPTSGEAYSKALEALDNPALNTTAETGGEVSLTLWAWIQSAYSSIVAKSVKSFIIGAWTVLKSVNDRLAIVELYGNEYEKQLALEGDYVNNAFSSAGLFSNTMANHRILLFPYIPKISFNTKQALIEVAAGVDNSLVRVVIYGSTNKRPFLRLFNGENLNTAITGVIADETIDFNFHNNTLYWVGVHTYLTPALRSIAAYTTPKINHTVAIGASNCSCLYFSSNFSFGTPETLEGISYVYAYYNIPLINFKVSSLL